MLALAVQPLRAQDSQFGIRGIGAPGRAETVRARSTGGAFAAFDAASAVSDVGLIDVRRLTATVVGWSAIRSVDFEGKSSTLHNSRFPLFTLAGPLGGHMALGGGYSSYLEHSYDLITRDSVVLRGVTAPFTDNNTNDGGVSDVRLAIATRVGSRLALGIGVHYLAGSDRLTQVRLFDDLSTYAAVRDTQTVRYKGWGVSGSIRLEPFYGVTLVGYAREDSKLDADVNGTPRGSTELPITVGAAVQLILKPGLRTAASVSRSNWSVAGPNYYDTMHWSAGAELGSGSGFLLRLGGRGGQFPYGPGGSAPWEWAGSAGLGRNFAGGHGALDFGAEYLWRSGAGMSEGVWTLMTALSVRQ
jgi:hypothetical protein